MYIDDITLIYLVEYERMLLHLETARKGHPDMDELRFNFYKRKFLDLQEKRGENVVIAPPIPKEPTITAPEPDDFLEELRNSLGGPQDDEYQQDSPLIPDSYEAISSPPDIEPLPAILRDHGYPSDGEPEDDGVNLVHPVPPTKADKHRSNLDSL